MTSPTGPTLLGFDVIFVATMLSAVATFAVLLALYAATTVKDPMARRVKALNERREQLKAGIVASTNKRKKLTNRNVAADRVRGILGSFRMLQDDQIQKTQMRLMQAGIRTKDLAFFIIFARFVMPVVLGAGAIVLIYVIDYFPDWAFYKKYGFVAATLVGSYKAPDIWLKNKVTKRSHAIRKGLPDALDLLVICAEAGLTVDAAFNRVAKELGKAYPELGDEFGLTAIELGFLAERRNAFENLANRVDLEAVRGVVTTMIQTEKYGTPLASALRVLSAEFRNERMMRAEEKAARLPAIMTIPLILFILPTLFIVILGPAACSISDNLMKG
ncbi:type II secretion system F family protein [Sphingomonas sp. LY29]|uniref:type II secretion system F family protein n=1 Tax=unclassified Sphingomonas TaxID=196159 RepID=UPI002ADED320|nr:MULTISPECIES: type II secretion system F family protein [unclassified Sphingomonas]MEA1071488.1 type II secretion system F family protein [Sphingomonas sp. LY160]WRP25833.1 type II secretion system F family protein [Sphingomonas sp. LY29]